MHKQYQIIDNLKNIDYLKRQSTKEDLNEKRCFMQTVNELVTELLKLPMNAYVAVGCNPFDEIEISIRHFDDDKVEEEFDFISLE